MGRPKGDEKLFKKEVGVFNHYKEFLSQDQPPDQTKKALEDLTRRYKLLLDQTKFLTWVSGMLERRLHRTNKALNEKNSRLESTLEQLVKATAGRNAYVIIYMIAIILFVLEEFFVEPVIGMFGSGLGLSILIKLVIVLVLKVSEGIIEERIKKKSKMQIIKPED